MKAPFSPGHWVSGVPTLSPTFLLQHIKLPQAESRNAVRYTHVFLFVASKWFFNGYYFMFSLYELAISVCLGGYSWDRLRLLVYLVLVLFLIEIRLDFPSQKPMYKSLFVMSLRPPLQRKYCSKEALPLIPPVTYHIDRDDTLIVHWQLSQRVLLSGFTVKEDTLSFLCHHWTEARNNTKMSSGTPKRVTDSFDD